MTITSEGDIAAARKALVAVRAELDAAVVALPNIEGMAPPGLVALLVRAVAARDHLDELETSERAAGDGDSGRQPRPRTI